MKRVCALGLAVLLCLLQPMEMLNFAIAQESELVENITASEPVESDSGESEPQVESEVQSIDEYEEPSADLESDSETKSESETETSAELEKIEEGEEHEIGEENIKEVENEADEVDVQPDAESLIGAGGENEEEFIDEIENGSEKVSNEEKEEIIEENVIKEKAGDSSSARGNGGGAGGNSNDSKQEKKVAQKNDIIEVKDIIEKGEITESGDQNLTNTDTELGEKIDTPKLMALPMLLSLTSNLGDNGILYQNTDWDYNDLIINVGGQTFIIMDRNLGASESNYTGSDSYGYHYQWGNNYGFDSDLSSSDLDKSGNSIDNPGNTYYSSTWRTNNASYISGDYAGLWGNGIDETGANQGPCPYGYHVPTQDELQGLVDAFDARKENANSEYSSVCDGIDEYDCFAKIYQMPKAGIRLSNGSVSDKGNIGNYRSSSKDAGFTAKYLTIDEGIETSNNSDFTDGLSVRCFKNEGFNVVYDTNGGSFIFGAKVNSGGYLVEPEIPTKEGYSFAGWYLTGMTTEWNFDENELTEAITLYAKWNSENNNYTVSFQTNGGTQIESIQVAQNTPILEPTAPTKSGYVFAGWYLAGMTTEWNFANNVTSDLTLYAKWTYPRCLEQGTQYPGVEWNCEKGTITISYGNESIVIKDKNVGATEVGYGSDASTASYGYQYQRGSMTGYDYSIGGSQAKSMGFIAGDNALYTQNSTGWTLEQQAQLCGVGYHILTETEAYNLYTMYANNGNSLNTFYEAAKLPFAGSRNPRTAGHNNSEEANLWTSTLYKYADQLGLKSKAMYLYANRTTAKNNMYGRDIGYNIRCAKDEGVDLYTVTFETNGGTLIESVDVIGGNPVSLPTEPTKEGYSFAGWYLEGMTTEWNFSDNVTSDMVLYAKWDSGETTGYTVNFETNGGNSIESVSVEENTPVIQPSNPTKSGYIFAGWYLEGMTIRWNFSDNVTSDMTLYAKWNYALCRNQGNQYTGVEWNCEQGTITITSGEKSIIMLDRNVGAVEPGYGFSASIYSYGNYYQWGGTTGYTYSMSAADAISQGFSTNNATYSANVNEWDEGELCPSGYRIPTIEEWNDIKLMFTRNGNNILYFYDAFKIPYAGYRDYSNAAIDYVGDSAYLWSISSRDNSSQRLSMDSYGVYNFDSYRTYGYSVRCILDENLVNYTVNFETNGGSYVESMEVTGNTPVIQPSNPTKSGYIFAGWYLEGMTTRWNFSDNVTSDMTLYAKWNYALCRNQGNQYTGVEWNCEQGTITLTDGSKSITILDRNIGATEIGYGWNTSTASTGSYGLYYQRGLLTGYSYGLSSGELLELGFIQDAATLNSLTTGWNEGDICPYGYHIPSKLEMDEFISIYTGNGNDTKNFYDAFKIPYAGYRPSDTLEMKNVGSYTDFWTTTRLNGTLSNLLYVGMNGNVYTYYTNKTYALPIRCMQNMETYTVNFETNGGSNISSVSVNENTPVIQPSNPIKTGYVFSGWYLTGMTTEWNFTNNVTSDMTLYAKWACNEGYSMTSGGVCIKEGKIAVTFISNPSSFVSGKFPDGNTQKTIVYELKEGGYYQGPEEIQVPELADNMFEGWYTDTDYAAAHRWAGLSGGTTYTEITLYARYLPFEDKEITLNGVTFTIMDRNLGATAVSSGYSYGASPAEVRGNYYQWGNNFGFPNNGTLTNTLSGVLVTNYSDKTRGPGNYYFNGTFIRRPNSPYRWDYADDANLWGGVTNTDESKKGPCPEGYHVPSTYEWLASRNLFQKWQATEEGMAYCNSIHATNTGTQFCMLAALGMPFAGYRNYSSSSVINQGSSAYYWSSTAYSANSADYLGANSSTLVPQNGNSRAYGFALRCFRDSGSLTLTFDSNGGSSVSSQKNFKWWNPRKTAPTAPTRANSTFAGWYTDEELTQEFTFSDTTYVSEDTTLYAKWIGNIYRGIKNGTLYISDNNIVTDGDTTINLTTLSHNGNFSYDATFNYSTTPWYSYKSSITSVKVIGNVAPTSTAYWFYSFSSCISMDLSGLDTSNVTDMKYMFYNCSNLTSLDVSHFDTSKVTNMSYMFYNCSELTSLDVSHFDTSNVTDMSYMFYNCSNLTSLDVSHFDTSKVTNMRSMFYDCSNLTSLDVSHFKTSNVSYMNYMFYNCSNLTSLDVSHFDTSKVTNMRSMFNKCSNLTSLDVSNFDTSKVTDMSYMFYNCSKLTSLDVSNFDTSKVTDMERMFYDCRNLTSLDLSNFDTSSVTGYSYMLTPLSSLIDLNVSASLNNKISFTDLYNYPLNNSKNRWIYNETEYTSTSSMQVNEARHYLAKVAITYKDMGGTDFSASTLGLTTYHTYGAETTLVSPSDPNFVGWYTNSRCTEDSRITKFPGEYRGNATVYAKWDVNEIYRGIDNGILYISDYTIVTGENASIDLTLLTNSGSFGYNAVFGSYSSVPRYSYSSSIKSVKVIGNVAPISTAYWFYYLNNCTSMDLSGLDTSNVTSMYDMFYNCSNLTSLDLSNFDTSKVTNMSYMLSSLSSLIDLNVSASLNNKISSTNLSMPLGNSNNRWSHNGTEYSSTSHMQANEARHYYAAYQIEYINKDGYGISSEDLVAYHTYGTETILINPDDPSFGGFFTNSGYTQGSRITRLGAYDYTGRITLYVDWDVDQIYRGIDNGILYISDSTIVTGENSSINLSLLNQHGNLGYNSERKPWMGSSVTSVKVVGHVAPTSTANWFYGLSNCISMDLSGLDTSNVIDMSYMFYGCSKLTSLDVSNWDTSKVTDMSYMFYNCSSLESLDVSNWDTSKVTDMYMMFYNCSSLESLDVSNWDTSKVTDMHEMFYNCSSLESLDVSNWDTSKVTDMYMMFYNCSSLESLDVSNFNTSKVTDMTAMFIGCNSLISLDLSSFDLSNVNNGGYGGMLRNLMSLADLKVSSSLNNYISSTALSMPGVNSNNRWNYGGTLYSSVSDMVANEARHYIATYPIIYQDEGGLEFSASTGSLPEYHTYGTDTILPNLYKAGDITAVWYTDSGCTAGHKITTLGATDYTGAITLYAKWTKQIGYLSIEAPEMMESTDISYSKSYSQDIILTGGYFKVLDYLGNDNGWYTTLSVTSLSGAADNYIDKSDISIRFNGVSVLGGDVNDRVVTNDSSGDFVSLESPVNYISRATGANNGKKGIYGTIPEIKVRIPAYQKADTYNGTLVFTIYEN